MSKLSRLLARIAKTMFFEASQEMTLQTKAFMVISMAVPVLTEKASDAVGHICAFQKQACRAFGSQV